MTFWVIFWPVFAALVSSFVVTELFNVVLGFYIHRKQERMRKDLEAKIASGEIDPISLLTGQVASPPGMDFSPRLTTASGEVDAPEVSHGQYL